MPTNKNPDSSKRDLTKNQKKKLKKRSKRLQSSSEDSSSSPTSNPSSPESSSESQVNKVTSSITELDTEPAKTTESVTRTPPTKSDDTNINPTSNEEIDADASKGKEKEIETATEIDDKDINSPSSNKEMESDDTNINSPASDEQIDPEPSTSGGPNTFEFVKPDYTNPKCSTSQEAVQRNVPDVYSDPQPSTSKDEFVSDDVPTAPTVKLYAPETGPQMYKARGNLVTPPIIARNLPQVFQFLPVHGKPGPNTTLEEFYSIKLRDYIGCGVTVMDEEFEDLGHYCSQEHLKTGNELRMLRNIPIMGLLNNNILHNNFSDPEMEGNSPNLTILKKNKTRVNSDTRGLFTKKLKYRGVRILPFAQQQNRDDDDPLVPTEPDVELEPGTDILYKVRIYRPYAYNLAKDRYTRSRHSVFCYDVLLTGRHKLTALRDRFNCHNDYDVRVDMSDKPESLPSAKAKVLFPSGFLFINNVFYVDTRKGCIDYSAPIREWALKRNIGKFTKKDMCKVRLNDLVLKLGYPEVYVHQGNCEHVFIFSEIRLLNANDPLQYSKYPCTTAIAQNQSVYCTTCAEFCAKWVVVGSYRLPFDPAFFCDTCFRQYMYKDGQKIGDFRAYRYRGNAMNFLKPS